jgi:hypothetical protein
MRNYVPSIPYIIVRQRRIARGFRLKWYKTARSGIVCRAFARTNQKN